MSDNKKTRIPVEVTEEQKDKIKKRADIVGMKTGPFLRTLGLSDDKVIVLNGAGNIAGSLADIKINLDRALRGKELNSDEARELITAFKEVKGKFKDILEMLPALLDPDDTEESEGDQSCL